MGVVGGAISEVVGGGRWGVVESNQESRCPHLHCTMWVLWNVPFGDKFVEFGLSKLFYSLCLA